ncbi:phd and ring finger domain-containing protein [Anaeramoeba flamelloides]|uniref:Phd and ring finger domain-containing protein n=1 Tax=Anaeramoeba flamelloides TaxID=1746091 RepID=A0AAV8ACE5_9EUKA|nr:phd and ring finger domain-containing protein [Anaeramoeba flamelloides]
MAFFIKPRANKKKKEFKYNPKKHGITAGIKKIKFDRSLKESQAALMWMQEVLQFPELTEEAAFNSNGLHLLNMINVISPRRKNKLVTANLLFVQQQENLKEFHRTLEFWNYPTIKMFNISDFIRSDEGAKEKLIQSILFLKAEYEKTGIRKDDKKDYRKFYILRGEEDDSDYSGDSDGNEGHDEDDVDNEKEAETGKKEDVIKNDSGNKVHDELNVVLTGNSERNTYKNVFYYEQRKREKYIKKNIKKIENFKSDSPSEDQSGKEKSEEETITDKDKGDDDEGGNDNSDAEEEDDADDNDDHDEDDSKSEDSKSEEEEEDEDFEEIIELQEESDETDLGLKSYMDKLQSASDLSEEESIINEKKSNKSIPEKKKKKKEKKGKKKKNKSNDRSESLSDESSFSEDPSSISESDSYSYSSSSSYSYSDSDSDRDNKKKKHHKDKDKNKPRSKHGSKKKKPKSKHKHKDKDRHRSKRKKNKKKYKRSNSESESESEITFSEENLGSLDDTSETESENEKEKRKQKQKQKKKQKRKHKDQDKDQDHKNGKEKKRAKTISDLDLDLSLDEENEMNSEQTEIEKNPFELLDIWNTNNDYFRLTFQDLYLKMKKKTTSWMYEAYLLLRYVHVISGGTEPVFSQKTKKIFKKYNNDVLPSFNDAKKVMALGTTYFNIEKNTTGNVFCKAKMTITPKKIKVQSVIDGLLLSKNWNKEIEFYIHRAHECEFGIGILKQNKFIHLKAPNKHLKQLMILTCLIFNKYKTFKNKIGHNPKVDKFDIHNLDLSWVPPPIVPNKKFLSKKSSIQDYTSRKVTPAQIIDYYHDRNGVNFLCTVLSKRHFPLAPGYIKLRKNQIKIGLGKQTLYKISFKHEIHTFRHPRYGRLFKLTWEKNNFSRAVYILNSKRNERSLVTSTIMKFVNLYKESVDF